MDKKLKKKEGKENQGKGKGKWEENVSEGRNSMMRVPNYDDSQECVVIRVVA